MRGVGCGQERGLPCPFASAVSLPTHGLAGPRAVAMEQQSACWQPGSPLCPVGWQVWAQVVHVWGEGSCSPAWDKLPLESDAFPRGSPSALGQACWPLLLLLLSAFSLGWGHSVWTLILPSTALSLPSRPFCRVAGMSFGQQPCLLKQKVVLG